MDPATLPGPLTTLHVPPTGAPVKDLVSPTHIAAVELVIVGDGLISMS